MRLWAPGEAADSLFERNRTALAQKSISLSRPCPLIYLLVDVEASTRFPKQTALRTGKDQRGSITSIKCASHFAETSAVALTPTRSTRVTSAPCCYEGAALCFVLPSVISRIGHPKGPDVLGCRPEKSGASGGRAAGCGIAGGGTVKWCAVDLLKR